MFGFSNNAIINGFEIALIKAEILVGAGIYAPTRLKRIAGKSSKN
jgi:hypothetical protein